jgi:hypothetical protein
VPSGRSLPRSGSWAAAPSETSPAVHLWYEDRFGIPVEPLTSTEDGIGTWPETVACVGIRLRDDSRLDVIAPFGLDDLFDLILRRNPRHVSLEMFRRRVREKGWLEHWPKVRMIDG